MRYVVCKEEKRNNRGNGDGVVVFVQRKKNNVKKRFLLTFIAIFFAAYNFLCLAQETEDCSIQIIPVAKNLYHDTENRFIFIDMSRVPLGSWFIKKEGVLTFKYTIVGLEIENEYQPYANIREDKSRSIYIKKQSDIFAVNGVPFRLNSPNARRPSSPLTEAYPHMSKSYVEYKKELIENENENAPNLYPQQVNVPHATKEKSTGCGFLTPTILIYQEPEFLNGD